jgi:hypothetical protein
MGFMDKLKSMANMVTGGGAKISLQIDRTITPGEKVAVIVRCQVEGAAVQASKVYVAARGVETVNLVHRDRDRDSRGDRDRVHDTEMTFSQEFVIHGAVQLAAGSTQEWRGEITLPTSAQPTYHGKHAKHDWSVLAAIDVSGNDPDSGWIEVKVR